MTRRRASVALQIPVDFVEYLSNCSVSKYKAFSFSSIFMVISLVDKPFISSLVVHSIICLQYSVFETPSFERMCRKLLKKYPHAKKDYLVLVESLKKGVFLGDQIPRVKRLLFKARIKSSDLNKGKSGGFKENGEN